MGDRNEPGVDASSASGPGPSVASPPAPEAAPEIHERLLRMADCYRARQEIHQAIAIYLELAEEHSETREGRLGRERLMAIALEYEQQGMLHQARGLYERLLSGSEDR